MRFLESRRAWRTIWGDKKEGAVHHTPIPWLHDESPNFTKIIRLEPKGMRRLVALLPLTNTTDGDVKIILRAVNDFYKQRETVDFLLDAALELGTIALDKTLLPAQWNTLKKVLDLAHKIPPL